MLGQKCLCQAHPQDTRHKLLELTQTHIWQFKITVIKKDTDIQLKGLDYPLLENVNEYVIHGFSFQNYLTELGYDDNTVEGNGIYGKSSVDRYVTYTCHSVSLWKWKWIFFKSTAVCWKVHTCTFLGRVLVLQNTRSVRTNGTNQTKEGCRGRKPASKKLLVRYDLYMYI